VSAALSRIVKVAENPCQRSAGHAVDNGTVFALPDALS
jgi:hypothetical protein